ncbi:alpha/beta hydrolase fold domain-containing protein [Chloroflexota bacterium]
MIILAYTLSGLSLLMSALFLIKPRVSLLLLLFLPLTAGALSPYWAIMGVVGAVLGWAYGALWAVPMGIVGAITMILYVWRCTRDHNGFENAFGADWSDQILPEQAKLMVQKRWSWYLKLKTSPEPSWERDIPFWTIPDTDRQLLCDIWRPADGKTSGLAYVYLHGSAWAMGDKDMYTSSLFSHLTAQGHTVMDVANRLIPEVDIYGMVGDAKRAVAWIKANADGYGVDPEKIVLGGGSAGAHIALLAGYTPEHPELTPEELKNADLSVCGMMTYYAPTDLVAGYEIYDVEKLSEKTPAVPIGTKADPKNPFLYAGRMDILLGGHPEKLPEVYQLACPTTHVHPGSPPTLLMQGDVDSLVPIEDTQALYAKLVESGVPAINVVFPWTQHAFDLLLPQFSPPAQSALYDVDRFLALMVNRN